MGLASMYEDNSEYKRKLKPLEQDELNNPPRHRKKARAKKLSPKQLEQLNQMFHQASDLGVLEIAKHLWNKAFPLYSSPRPKEGGSASFWEVAPFRKAKNGNPIYRGVFYMGLHPACLDMSSNYVFVSLSPASLSLLTGKTEAHCRDFLSNLSNLLDAPLYDWKYLKGWHFLPLSTVKQASIFLTEINNFIGK